MDIAAFLKILEEDWIAIASALFSIISAVVFGIWWVVWLFKKREIAGLNTTINTKQALIELLKYDVDHNKERVAVLEIELEIVQDASAKESIAKQHSLAASAIASEVRVNLEGMASTLASAPRHTVLTTPDTNVSELHLLRDIISEPVPFKGMSEKLGGKKNEGTFSLPWKFKKDK